MLLHACCGPCASAVAPYFRQIGIEPVLFYYNPNIQPLAEYEKRRQSLLQMAQEKSFSVVISDQYNPFPHLHHALHQPKDRCTYCYTDRLQNTAKEALRLGFRQFSTTLLVSPYQDRDRIVFLGHQIAFQYGLEFLAPDLRSLYPQTKVNAIAMDLYRQQYCGCLMSEYERHYPDKGILL